MRKNAGGVSQIPGKIKARLFIGSAALQCACGKCRIGSDLSAFMKELKMKMTGAFNAMHGRRGARPLRGALWGSIRSLRDLRVDPISPPG